jgi:peptide/nickel transport system substrate-binding protein
VKRGVVVLLLFLFACSNQSSKTVLPASENEKYGDAFIVADLSDASYLNPILASDTSSSQINSMIFNGLIKYDKDLKIVGDLAESFQVLDDGLVLIFKLRKNIVWHDGQPFTARDVEFTYKALINPDVQTPFSSMYLLVKDFIVVDDYTIKIVYDKPFAPNLESWGMGIIPKHIFEGSDINTSPANRKPIGTGPYKLDTWDPDQKIVLIANDDYFEGRPFIDRYIVRVVPDQSVQFFELRNESLDAVSLSPDQWNAYDSFFTHYDKFRQPMFSVTFLGFNMRKKPFDDKRFRLAIEYAVNKDDIVKGVLLGFGSKANSPFPPQSWAANNEIAQSQYDPQKALELLKEIGFEDIDNDGWLEYQGSPFSFSITTNQGNKQRELSAQIIQENLKKIGIKTSIRIIEFSTFINQYIAKRDFDALIMGWSLTLDPDQHDLWHSSQMGEKQYNFLSYKNQRVDELLVYGRSVFDVQKRKRAYYEIQEIMRQDPPCIFLYFPDSLEALHKRFEGIEPAPSGIYHNFIKWYVPKTQMKYGMGEI